jgi:hypothetical protein
VNWRACSPKGDRVEAFGMQSPHLQHLQPVSRLSQSLGRRCAANQGVGRLREAGSRSLDPEAGVANDVVLCCNCVGSVGVRVCVA